MTRNLLVQEMAMNFIRLMTEGCFFFRKKKKIVGF